VSACFLCVCVCLKRPSFEPHSEHVLSVYVFEETISFAAPIKVMQRLFHAHSEAVFHSRTFPSTSGSAHIVQTISTKCFQPVQEILTNVPVAKIPGFSAMFVCALMRPESRLCSLLKCTCFTAQLHMLPCQPAEWYAGGSSRNAVGVRSTHCAQG
jgi:hypothetical protein